MIPDYFVIVRNQFLVLSKSKIFEKVICINLLLKQYNRLYPYQFRFHINYSTNNALITITERLAPTDTVKNLGVVLDNRFLMIKTNKSCSN